MTAEHNPPSNEPANDQPRRPKGKGSPPHQETPEGRAPRKDRPRGRQRTSREH